MAEPEGGKSNNLSQEFRVAIFRPYPFQVGQKIYIDRGPRQGDWEVMAVDEETVRMRCPLSLREVQWAHFCYLAWEGIGEPWPHH